MWHGKLIPNRVENHYTSSANSAVFTSYAGVERYCASRMRVFPNAYIIGTWKLSSSQAKKRLVFKNVFSSRELQTFNRVQLPLFAQAIDKKYFVVSASIS